MNFIGSLLIPLSNERRRFRHPLIARIRERLAEAADQARAVGMWAYMKSTMPYRRVASPGQKAIFRDVLREHPLVSFEDWQNAALTLWRDAEFREERYAAIAITGGRRYRHFHTLAAMPMHEETIVSGAWWDYVARTTGAEPRNHVTAAEGP
jgi:hypothetical protein